MLSSDSNEVESILSWTSEERRSEPARPADSTGSSWPDDQAESILDVDEGSSTWSGVERFSDDAQVESDFQELVDHDSVSTKSSDKQHGSLEKESGAVATLKKIEAFALDILQQINRSGKYQTLGACSPGGTMRRKLPIIVLLKDRSSPNPEKHRKLRFPRDTRNRSSGSGIRELSQLLRVLELSHDAILGKMIMTKRDVFYNDVNLFKKQVVVDRLVDDLAATFEITRGQLHFAASPKGLFQGDLELVIIGDTITSGHGPPALIPPEDTIKELKPGPNIRFILIVEKEGIGYPSLSTRQLASRLSEHQEVVKRRVPILILVDCDPHGLDIAKVYKFGSQSMSFHPGLRAKQAEWIGISSSDWNEFNIDCDLICPMTLHDYKKADSLLMSDVLPESWKNEVRRMKETRKKSEIQILCSQADPKGKATDHEMTYQNSNHRLFFYLSKKIKRVRIGI
ncbi:uncharacterized protein PGTG_08619 [Puccinia graminis f. sp. tritici CRL 75-36-700-3]|uniref:DNA topoisomerase (ATP-hydrolyzing) n=1 Tax=Puccinia graminis f. sp. tritici (strain CRL 75-36-700-3 / race SCCL) TaxID=418459 RepID=E3KGK8_PUCGT|nr:uncharacterized protein PGTG_08619 [Puccinia graminis f. sp. tritici CRL 75-36-700-3]EFP83433.2 hypothetical protein PGTG_08619 [Puccinia graminis f. sp. tritici CRL 75-36-700-3]